MALFTVDLLAFLSLGLLGAGHCAGMCGGFSIAVVTRAGASRWVATRAELTYLSGKALMYSVLGLGVALLGLGFSSGGRRVLGPSAPSVVNIQWGLSWLAGGTMIWLGVRAIRGARVGNPEVTGGILRRPLATLRSALRGAMDLPGGSGNLAAGLVTGILPCGLSWGALALCIGKDPLHAMLGMLVFGAATGPVLLVVGLGWQGVSVRYRGAAARLTGPLLIGFGLLTALRGAPAALQPARGIVLPDCCADVGGHPELEGGAQHAEHSHP
jgi:sulfite exporter TauE/SafE